VLLKHVATVVNERSCVGRTVYRSVVVCSKAEWDEFSQITEVILFVDRKQYFTILNYPSFLLT
jgi:hypothetical protein